MLFQRLAKNFIKNGYFPTDEETLGRILNALAPAPSGQMTIFDPAAGEGVALAECKQYLGADHTIAYGIEIDEERAWHAKQLLDRCLHGDLMDAVLGKQSFGLLFLNPPYGDLAADKSGGETVLLGGRKRLEKLFYRQCIGSLQLGGVLVLIVPYYVFDSAFADLLARHLVQVQVFLAPEQQFKQAVLLGIRGRGAEDPASRALHKRLVAIGQGQLPETLPATWDEVPYVVPTCKNQTIPFGISRLDARQLAAVIAQSPCLWEQFDTRFQQGFGAFKRPLMDLSQWHLALALAAGQVSGMVQSHDGRCYLIRGSTHKVQQETVNCEVDDNNHLTETRILLDRFVTVLRALDLTPNSATYGHVLTIR